jgi:hypothetical protein
MWDTPIYAIWSSMLQRCENRGMPAYDRYGGRGIQVCDEWHDFDVFYDDMGPRPDETYSLDRIDNDGDYCPGNCRWATKKQQSRNRADNRLLTFKGESLCIAEWADRLPLKDSTIRMRLRRGWSTKEALTVKADLGNRWR